MLSQSIKATLQKHILSPTQVRSSWGAALKSFMSSTMGGSTSSVARDASKALRSHAGPICRILCNVDGGRQLMRFGIMQNSCFPSKSLHSGARGGSRRWWSGQSAGLRLFSTPSGNSRARLMDEARRKRMRAKNLQIAMYMGGMTLFTISFTYASVPLYRIFCQKTGFAGTVKTEDVDYGQRAKPVSGKRLLTIKFNADVSETMPWKFIPQQHEVRVVPGEAALVFYKAMNKTSQPIIGVASYNVQPEGAAAYFNKIQCFCFEEQMLGPNEKIDMPVFFFIDPDFLNDKNMDGIETITLSYTFWKSGDANAPDIATMLAQQPHAAVYPRPTPTPA